MIDELNNFIFKIFSKLNGLILILFEKTKIIELKQAFNMYDVEGTGYLRIQEIDSVLRSLGIFPTGK